MSNLSGSSSSNNNIPTGSPSKFCQQHNGGQGEYLPLSAFAKDKHQLDGLTSACKECRRARSKEWYAQNREEKIDHSLEYKSERWAEREARGEYPLIAPPVKHRPKKPTEPPLEVPLFVRGEIVERVKRQLAARYGKEPSRQQIEIAIKAAAFKALDELARSPRKGKKQEGKKQGGKDRNEK